MSLDVATEKSEKKVVIDVSKSRSAGVFDAEDGLIQRSALRDVELFVRKTLSKISAFRKELDAGESQDETSFTRIHDTILLCGARGSGKSTFMHSAIRHLCHEDINAPGQQDIAALKSYSLLSLGVIDPTLISSREHIFLLIIAKIRNLVEKKFSEGKEKTKADERDWLDQLSDLSRGLCMQDGIGHSPLDRQEWDDPGFILAEGLANAQSGIKLERKFHRFINASLKIIGKDAFLLGFDDIDTDFSKGWPVLELLRKYLTSPQLIVLLSGDYDLYSKLVRRQQWEQFKDHPQLVIHYGQERLEGDVEKLEAQYIIKILRPTRRIDLKLAWELPKDLFVRIPGKGKEVLLRHVMSAFTEIWYKFPQNICKRIGGLFTHLPLRNLINLLILIEGDGLQSLAAGQGKRESRNNITYERALEWAAAAKKEIPEIQSCEVLPASKELMTVHSGLILIHYDRLIAMGFTADDLQSVQWVGQFGTLAKVLYERELLKYGADLLPANVMQQDGLDVLILSGIFMSAMLSDIKHVVDYYVRVLIVRDFYFFLQYKNESSKDKSRKYELDTSLFSQQQSLMDIAVYMSRKRSDDDSLFGRYKEFKGNEVKATEENFFIPEWGELLFNALMLSSNGDLDENRDENVPEKKFFFSPYNFIALFGLCLGADEGLEFDFKRFQYPESISEFGNAKPDNKVSDSMKAALSSKQLGIQAKLIHDWASKYHDEQSEIFRKQQRLLLPPYVHASIWRRFMDDWQSDDAKTITDAINKFEQAVKVEEKQFRWDEQLEFFNFIENCPLFGMLRELDIYLKLVYPENHI